MSCRSGAMKLWIVLLASLLLSGCASPPPAQPPQIFDDALFAPASEPIAAADVFALSPAMQRYIDVDLAKAIYARGGRAALLEAMYSRKLLKLEYDTAMTRNAAQAFDARSGNCLSLVIMTAAFAKQLGLPVEFHSVYVDENWSRSGDLLVTNGHVNLTLNHRSGDPRFRFDVAEALLIDFDPPAPGQHQLSRVISENTVLGMFMNNRAAEALAAGRNDDAYWWARAAIEHAPDFMPAYNTLGVIYLRRGALVQAERVLQHVLAQEPANTRVLANLQHVLGAQGRTADAQRLAQRLASIEPTPPFHFFRLGVDALQRRDYAAARSYFTKEIDRSAHYHEFYFGLALADFGLGRFAEAREQLGLAMQSSPSVDQRELYAGKLERMKAARLQ